MDAFFAVLWLGALLAVVGVCALWIRLRGWDRTAQDYVRLGWWTLPLALPLIYDSLAKIALGALGLPLPWVAWPGVWNLLAVLRMIAGATALLPGAVLAGRLLLRRDSGWVRIGVAALCGYALPYLLLGLTGLWTVARSFG